MIREMAWATGVLLVCFALMAGGTLLLLALIVAAQRALGYI